MSITMNHFDLALFLLVYSFLGWITEAGYYAVARREFCNRGILSLPLIPSYGITFVLLLIVTVATMKVSNGNVTYDS